MIWSGATAHPISALTVNDNTVSLNLPPAAVQSAAQASTPPAPATAPVWTPDIPWYTLDGSMTPALPGTKAVPGLDRRPGSKSIRVWGTAPPDGFHATLAIDDPAEIRRSRPDGHAHRAWHSGYRHREGPPPLLDGHRGIPRRARGRNDLDPIYDPNCLRTP